LDKRGLILDLLVDSSLKQPAAIAISTIRCHSPGSWARSIVTHRSTIWNSGPERTPPISADAIRDTSTASPSSLKSTR